MGVDRNRQRLLNTAHLRHGQQWWLPNVAHIWRFPKLTGHSWATPRNIIFFMIFFKMKRHPAWGTRVSPSPDLQTFRSWCEWIMFLRAPWPHISGAFFPLRIIMVDQSIKLSVYFLMNSSQRYTIVKSILDTLI